jgi:hypothetical protein
MMGRVKQPQTSAQIRRLDAELELESEYMGRNLQKLAVGRGAEVRTRVETTNVWWYQRRLGN